jgi:hypothetical protein
VRKNLGLGPGPISSVTYSAIWRCHHISRGRCGCECGGCASLKEMRYLLREICSHLQISGYMTLLGPIEKQILVPVPGPLCPSVEWSLSGWFWIAAWLVKYFWGRTVLQYFQWSFFLSKSGSRPANTRSFFRLFVLVTGTLYIFLRSFWWWSCNNQVMNSFHYLRRNLSRC